VLLMACRFIAQHAQNFSLAKRVAAAEAMLLLDNPSTTEAVQVIAKYKPDIGEGKSAELHKAHQLLVHTDAAAGETFLSELKKIFPLNSRFTGSTAQPEPEEKPDTEEQQ
jgi:hypothetical protein